MDARRALPLKALAPALSSQYNSASTSASAPRIIMFVICLRQTRRTRMFVNCLQWHTKAAVRYVGEDSFGGVATWEPGVFYHCLPISNKDVLCLREHDYHDDICL